MTRAARHLACAVLFAAAAAWAQQLDEGELPKVAGEGKARIQNVEQHLNDWNVEAAQAELAALKKVVPEGTAWVAYLEGRVAFEEGRYDDALAGFEKAGLTDKPGARLTWTRLAKDTLKVVGQHEKAESAHFVVFYAKGKDAVLVPYTLEALEKQRAALEADLGYAPPGKVRVEFVGSASELAKVSTLSREAIRTTGTIAICKFNKLMVTSPRGVIHGYDWLDTLSHEYAHLVISRKSHNNVPIWLHEGLAKYLESRWRGQAGLAMTPSTLALLGTRVKKGTLVPFEKMHPSMALLPTAEDAATAFAEVYFAVDLIHREAGPGALKAVLEQMATGVPDRAAVEAVTKRSWPQFEKAWMAHLKKQPFPKGLVPPSAKEKKELAESAPGKAKKEKGKPREVSFGDFAEVAEVDARRAAHLGELMRERRRMPAAAEQYEKAWRVVGDRYESVSNKYALALLELKRFEEAERVLLGSLTMHPGSAQTSVHLGRLALRQKAWGKARAAFLDAVAVDPFNEEIHVSLYRAAEGLGDGALKARAQAAAALLLELKPEQVAELAARLGKDDESLVDPGLGAPREAEKTPPAAPAQRSGRADPAKFMLRTDGG